MPPAQRNTLLRLTLLSVLFTGLLAGCILTPTALPPAAPGAAATFAAETLSALAPAKTQSAQQTVDRLTRQAPTLTPSISPTRPTATPIPTNTLPFSLLSLTPPTLTPTATTIPLIITAVADTNCRLRPAPDEQRLGIFYAGQQATVYGTNADQSWWYIKNPENSAEYCWVWSGSITVSGEIADLPLITPATPLPFTDFEITFSNMHLCIDTRFLVFRVENTGTETLYVATIAVKNKGGETLHSDILWAPYMNEASWCPPGRYTLESGKRGFIYIKKVDKIKRGVRLWAEVKICTEKKPGQTCVEKTVQFQF